MFNGFRRNNEISDLRSEILVVRVERFELITKLILSQPPLPLGLHAHEFEI
jgi:hypothetical protein